MTSEEDAAVFVSTVFLILFPFSHLPTTLSLPQGRLIKTNAIAGYHCYAGAQRAAGSYFSFSLVDDVILFSSEIDLSLMALFTYPFFPLFPIPFGARVRMHTFGLHCHITKSLQISKLHHTEQALVHTFAIVLRPRNCINSINSN